MEGVGIPAATKATVSLAKIPFDFHRRVRIGKRIPQDLKGLRSYRDWLLRGIESCRPALDKKDVQSWLEQLSDAEKRLDKVKPEHRKGIRDRHVDRDNESLAQAEEIISRVKDQLDNTFKFVEMSTDTFEVYYCKPDMERKSYSHCDQADHQGRTVREGKLRQLLLSAKKPPSFTALYCAYGPGGMGKTVALEWLSSDSDVRKYFKHGIHWFAFGSDIEDGQLMEQIRICALNCGWKQLADDLMNEASLKVAIHKLGAKFLGKTLLFIIDDVWDRRREDVLSFRKALHGGQNCAMVISCREGSVSKMCDKIVPFDFLEPMGDVSRDILLSCVDENRNGNLLQWLKKSKECTESLKAGLQECGGWVLILSIVGAMLREEIENCEDVEEATEVLRRWAHSVVEEADLTGEGTREYPGGLHHIVGQGLKHAKQNLIKRGFPESLSSSVAENFRRLCVIQKQKAMPVHVLMKVWSLGLRETRRIAKTMKEMSLIEFGFDKSTVEVIRVHDKIIDLCREQMGTEAFRYHEELLESFVSHSKRIHWHKDVWYRPWWVLSGRDEYLMENLEYHLAEANLVKELWGVVCDARFIMRWLEDGRQWVGLADKFARVVRAGLGVNEGLEELQRALQSSWTRVRMSRYSLGFHMFGHLDKRENKRGSDSVCRFLETMELFETGPWVQPVKPFLEPSNSQEKQCYRLGNKEDPLWISEDVSIVVLLDMHGLINVLNLRNQEYVRQFEELEMWCMGVIAFSIDGKYALVDMKRRNGRNAYVMDLQRNGAPPLVVKGVTRNRPLTACAIHSRNLYAIGYEDGTLVLTSMRADGTEKRTHLSAPTACKCASFSTDGKCMASGHHYGAVKLWRVVDGQNMCSFSCGWGNVTCVSFNADGNRIASASSGNIVHVWSISDKEGLCWLSGHEGRVNCVVLSSDGTIVASGSDDWTVRVWRVSDRKQLCLFSGHYRPVRTLKFSADGKFLAIGGGDHTVRVWSVSDDPKHRSLSGHKEIVYGFKFCEDGMRVASLSSGKNLRVWNVKDGKKRFGVSCGQLYLGSERWDISADGTLVASGCSDNTVRLWSVNDDKQLCSLLVQGGGVKSVRFSADGTRLASESWNNGLRIWRASDGKQLCSLHEDRINLWTLSADGTRVAFVSADNVVQVWSVRNSKQLCSLSGHEGYVHCVTFNADGTRVASGAADNTVRVWSVHEDKQVCSLSGHEGHVVSVAFSADGSRVASGSKDKTVRIWRVESDTCEAEHVRRLPAEASEIRFVSGGGEIAAFLDDGSVLTLNFPHSAYSTSTSDEQSRTGGAICWQVTKDEICVRRETDGQRNVSVATFPPSRNFASNWRSKSTAHQMLDGKLVICRLRGAEKGSVRHSLRWSSQCSMYVCIFLCSLLGIVVYRSMREILDSRCVLLRLS
ncbi:hypothetical protein BWQ96_07835 [Gracilariopsis chorda]|uniref:NB-ARC domain-containing protein n=1 Tax=Gracilariopsis chorda TaxID=448386 RepID=A0A2V3IK60_9FLOR|nr:hypothetical protein BWQ96_07835 [Gracilariopsis chorda]|eukprot:PXF42457.1 hypothetical protein BWQ96_07835 [Gracilariopsis chorda]